MADALMGVTETSAAGLDVIGSVVQSYLQQESKMLPLITNYSNLVVKGAKTVQIPRSGGFSVGSKDENTSVDSQVITYATDEIALTDHRVVQFLLEDIANEQAVPAIVEDALMKAGKDMARDVDQIVINELELTSESTPDHRVAYIGAAIAEADILAARQALIVQNIDPNELFMAINPVQETAMLKITNFIDASKYGGGVPLFSGEIGKVFGVRVIVHNDIESLKTLMWHPSALGYAAQLSMRVQREYDLKELAWRYSLDHLFGKKQLDSGKRAYLIGTDA